MSDCPILFSAPMVRAIRAGRKTQMRRVIKNPDDGVSTVIEDGRAKACDQYGDWHERECPYGNVGDRLFVRESFYVQPDLWKRDHGPQPIHYAECIGHREEVEDYVRKPSMHMPRWACRLVLEITEVRVERLQEITETDAISEGCIDAYGPDFHVGAFRTLWNLFHEKRGFGWDTNPWVWVITFRVMDGKP